MRIWFSFIKNNQQNLSLIIGYILVALLFFNLGRFHKIQSAPEIKVEEPAIDLSQIYDSVNLRQLQSGASDESVAGSSEDNCTGRIKGNISSSGKIYHMPGGSFYKRTNPELCFDTESDALQAGFRKSLR